MQSAPSSLENLAVSGRIERRLGGTRVGELISFLPVLTMTGFMASLAVDAIFIGLFHAHTVVLLTMTILTSMYSISMAFEKPPQGRQLFLQRLVLSLFPLATGAFLGLGVVCTFVDDPSPLQCRDNFAPVFPALCVYMFESIAFSVVGHLSLRRAATYQYTQFRSKAVIGILAKAILYILTLSTFDIVRDLYSEPGTEITLTASTWATSCATIVTAFAVGQVMMHGEFDMMMMPKRRIWTVDIIMIFVVLSHLIMTGLTYAAELFSQQSFLNSPYLIAATALNDIVFSFCVSYHRARATAVGLELGLVRLRADLSGTELRSSGSSDWGLTLRPMERPATDPPKVDGIMLTAASNASMLSLPSAV